MHININIEQSWRPANISYTRLIRRDRESDARPTSSLKFPPLHHGQKSFKPFLSGKCEFAKEFLRGKRRNRNTALKGRRRKRRQIKETFLKGGGSVWGFHLAATVSPRRLHSRSSSLFSSDLQFSPQNNLLTFALLSRDLVLVSIAKLPVASLTTAELQSHFAIVAGLLLLLACALARISV